MAYTTIPKSSDYMTASIWTGNGTKITTGFSPDLIWFKARNAVSYAGILNAITGYDKYLQSFSTDAETTSAGMMVTDSTGYTPGSVLSSNSYVGWSWKANGAGVSNTSGSITSTVSASATSGFSIVSYTGNQTSGATVAHGLGSKPAMMIFKERNGTTSWVVYHHKNTSAPATEYLQLNSSNATGDYAGYFNDTEPTSSVFTLGNDTGINQSGDTYIAYCFAEKQGYSKFGSYIGNGNADGTFVYLGFKPAFVMAKSSTSVTEWHMADTARRPNNPNDVYLAASSSAAESTSNGVDFLSNGIKINTSQGGWNQSGATFIYMAFAEEPLVGDNPATAR